MAVMVAGTQLRASSISPTRTISGTRAKEMNPHAHHGREARLRAAPAVTPERRTTIKSRATKSPDGKKNHAAEPQTAPVATAPHVNRVCQPRDEASSAGSRLNA